MLYYFSHSLSARALYAFFIAFFCGMVFLPLFIRLSKRRRLVEKIKVETEVMKKQGVGKKNTPTMGGVIIVFSYLQTILLCGNWHNIYLLIALVIVVAFSSLGISDDLIKTYTKRKGLKARTKLVVSLIFALAICYFMHLFVQDTSGAIALCPVPISTGMWFILSTIVIAGSCHGVNLTDGIDGLAAGCSLMVIAFFTGLLILSPESASEQVREIIVSNFALCGVCCAFLWFNSYPAQVFMGDCGALMLGAYIGYVAVITQQHLLLVIAGGVFVVETLSSMIQMFTKKYLARKVFICAPLHHHFLAKGISEPQLVVRFWICQIFLIFAAISLCIHL
ncbi:phospho-N-acetylmuramoyl-pentapeptide-transferase [Candidatus Uabimicrobium amorphum]|uniref:Phospho-N-acetylmuramoyl-pentapeptide-transferase n=1 Tax=Uabimicrobium amorphum TaxID=2596890 RepID=A0A5S9IL53_UABAM|nr:phospho-N-acetylmuramoyl-pentapeptide-transferase [Candidatus Uabimicrobium amorphum]BBM83456.1 phospho-N-acetylmuramoyl-pentapeptide-transferase [Candidatus Uabimicrobium amorphum]